MIKCYRRKTRTYNNKILVSEEISGIFLCEESKRPLNKNILLNGIFVDTRNSAHLGDVLTIVLNYPEDNSNIVPKKMHLDIVYEDEHILAINKPAGIAVHPSFLHFDDSLANGVKYYFDTIGLEKKIRAVNRIDLNTSGLVLFAKNEYIQECLIKQMNSSLFEKIYLAVVCGKLPKKIGTINAPIARKENSIIERKVSNNGQTAITHYEILQEFENYSLVKCILETGRTHQIRCQLSENKMPIKGDLKYGAKRSEKMGGIRLHAGKIALFHPVTKEYLEFFGDFPFEDNLWLEVKKSIKNIEDLEK